ncbi:Eco57I restriction-modification methylase domain-containing protein, partial [Alkalihalophilus lindianensis]
QKIEENLPKLLKQSQILSGQYDVVCTNPPYMGKSGMNPKLTKYLNDYYNNTKFDLFAAFIDKGFSLAKKTGFNSMVTMQSWMFLSSY